MSAEPAAAGAAGAADPRQPTPQRLPPQDGVQRTPLRPPTEHRPAPQQPPEPLSQAGAEPHGTWECAGVPQQRTPLRLPPQDGVQRTPLRPPAGEHEPPPRQWPDPPLPRGAEADFADGGRGNRDEQYSEPLFQHDWQQPPARGDCLTEAQARNMAAAEEYEEFLNDNSARFYEQNGRPYWAESKEGEQPAYPGHYAAEAPMVLNNSYARGGFEPEGGDFVSVPLQSQSGRKLDNTRSRQFDWTSQILCRVLAWAVADTLVLGSPISAQRTPFLQASAQEDYTLFEQRVSVSDRYFVYW
ncbi:unnamed protein product [Prorocentrum cordatum]|uniref:Uncharacterized protein n=1 Tax=Prorocentrum cordatum TaxID=2364126 RepID=A0ABN9XUT1_9DINO|nr:unnamed protein product [Polarella glacialis]